MTKNKISKRSIRMFLDRKGAYRRVSNTMSLDIRICFVIRVSNFHGP